MTFQEMIDQVADIIQDPSFTPEDIGDRINRAVQKVCAGVLLPGSFAVSPPMPDLYTVGEINTVPGSGVVDLPEDYGRGLALVVNEAGDEVPIEPSFIKLLKRHPVVKDGDIQGCAAQGRRFVYRDSPTAAETLTIHYYRKPDLLEDEDESPDYIPENFHYSVLVADVARELFDLLEDGISGPKANVTAWQATYHSGVHDLGVFLGADGEAVNIGEPEYGDHIA